MKVNKIYNICVVSNLSTNHFYDLANENDLKQDECRDMLTMLMSNKTISL